VTSINVEKLVSEAKTDKLDQILTSISFKSAPDNANCPILSQELKVIDSGQELSDWSNLLQFTPAGDSSSASIVLLKDKTQPRSLSISVKFKTQNFESTYLDVGTITIDKLASMTAPKFFLTPASVEVEVGGNKSYTFPPLVSLNSFKLVPTAKLKESPPEFVKYTIKGS
jgi:hypothetical protein